MQPALLPDRPHLRPNVVGEVQDVAGVEAKSAAVHTEKVGKLAAPTAATFEQGARRVVARECRRVAA
jgi:hypothetical protein